MLRTVQGLYGPVLMAHRIIYKDVRMGKYIVTDGTLYAMCMRNPGRGEEIQMAMGSTPPNPEACLANFGMSPCDIDVEEYNRSLEDACEPEDCRSEE